MNTIPDWPPSPGPRILSLVGNDVTIDIRARKTASSLARSGFSVITIGVDANGHHAPIELLDGALIWRVRPTADPSVSSRKLRYSRAEIRERMWFRLEKRRLRLQARRRNATAHRYFETREDPTWVKVTGNASAGILRWLGIASDERDRVREGLNRRLRFVDRKVRFGPSRMGLILEQKVTGLVNLAYKWLARPEDRFSRAGNWRRDLPELHRYEAAIGGVVDALEPNLIHVHDVFHIGLASRAKARAAADGRTIEVVYDAHEYVYGLPIDTRRRLAYSQLEAEYIKDVDAVVTVAPEMAEAIARRYDIAEPEVVTNSPDLETAIDVESVRTVCNVPTEEPLVVYVGGIAPHRGAELMLDAMSRLPNAHLALVVGPITNYVQGLLDSAPTYGLEGRLHVAPFVGPEGVVSYLRGSDASLIPLSREVENYEVTLPNKLFQSIQANVPVVVSDSPAMARFVTTHGVGEVFNGGDADSLATSIRSVLTDTAGFSEALGNSELLKETTWATQFESLLEVYRRLGVVSE